MHVQGLFATDPRACSWANYLAEKCYQENPNNQSAVSMSSGLDNPLLVFVVSVLVQVLAAHVGRLIGWMKHGLGQDEREDFSTLQTASLTLLGLIIGFSFSMAVSRYDQRKNLEEAEANAIGTEYVRADLLPPEDTPKVHELLRRYTDLRVSFYSARGEQQLQQINDETAKVQAQLWATILPAAAKQSLSPVVALIISGMNDVLNSQGYTQAAWWNRIPIAAWGLMGLIAVSCNVLVGYGAHRRSIYLLLILPTIVSISFFLIADIDSPRGGVIRVLPQNLIAQAQSMKPN
jgi:hypothetical protein